MGPVLYINWVCPVWKSSGLAERKNNWIGGRKKEAEKDSLFSKHSHSNEVFHILGVQKLGQECRETAQAGLLAMQAIKRNISSITSRWGIKKTSNQNQQICYWKLVHFEKQNWFVVDSQAYCNCFLYIKFWHRWPSQQIGFFFSIRFYHENKIVVNNIFPVC